MHRFFQSSDLGIYRGCALEVPSPICKGHWGGGQGETRGVRIQLTGVGLNVGAGLFREKE